jgi:putative membrane protein
MKLKTLILSVGLLAALAIPWQASMAADEQAKANATEKKFIKKAANGGMMEVELGKVAAEKGQNQEVKDFGNRMAKDHSKANDDLKEVASKLGVTVPDKLNTKHQAALDKFSKMSSGDAFDKAYAKDMVNDHEKDVAEFEEAQKEVKNADLKQFIDSTLPVLKEHLDLAKKMKAATTK